MPNKIFRRTHDPIWHLQLGVVVVVVLQLFTAPALLPYNKYVIILLEVGLLAILGIVTPDAYHHVSNRRRALALTLIGVIAFDNILSLLLLLEALITHNAGFSGPQLLINAVVIYVTNIFMFALLYWEMDGGGPDRRATGKLYEDFMFTQMANPRFAGRRWLPGFTDYLYLSSTNVTNFASADAVPLTHLAKIVMMTQALVSVALTVLVLARAISILH